MTDATPSEVKRPPGERYVPGIKVNHDAETAHRNIRSAVARGLKPLLPGALNDRPIAICGGGPSLLGMLSRIKRYQKDKGYAVLAVNGAWRPLADAWIKPDYVAIADAAPRMVGLVPKVLPWAEYLIASKCDPALFDALPKEQITLWHAWDGFGEEKLLAEIIGEREPWCVVSGGCTVGLRSIDLAWIKGHRRFELFGFDSSFSADQQHAYENVTDYGQVIECRAQGSDRTFLTSPQMARQVTDFLSLLNRWNERYPGTTVRVHGDGLLPEAARKWNEEVWKRSGGQTVAPT